ncbi:hypothetical protein HDU92_003536 [Lobulomyces angularis]|nr:hypothetical protein HDU92_003536 [Lobulomyces angularis]
MPNILFTLLLLFQSYHSFPLDSLTKREVVQSQTISPGWLFALILFSFIGCFWSFSLRSKKNRKIAEMEKESDLENSEVAPEYTPQATQPVVQEAAEKNGESLTDVNNTTQDNEILKNAFPLSETSIALSWLIAIIITLIESAFGIFILSILLLQKRSDRVFDIVLRKNCPQLYINNENSFGQDNLILGKEFKNSFTEIFCFLLTLPINLIPVIGQGLFIIANGYIQGPRVHTRYFVKKKWSQEEIAKHLSKYRSDYTRFGCAKVLFESVPILNMISEYIFASAAAMWASELENSAVRLNSERL